MLWNVRRVLLDIVFILSHGRSSVFLPSGVLHSQYL